MWKVHSAFNVRKKKLPTVVMVDTYRKKKNEMTLKSHTIGNCTVTRKKNEKNSLSDDADGIQVESSSPLNHY